MIFYRSLTAAIAGSFAFLQVAAWASSPMDQLRPAVEEVIRILDDPSLKPESRAKERQARVRAAVVDRFDFSEMARRTLGLHWRSLSEPEREEFIRLFRALLEHTYLPKIALYRGERVRFVGESVDGELATTGPSSTRSSSTTLTGSSSSGSAKSWTPPPAPPVGNALAGWTLGSISAGTPSFGTPGRTPQRGTPGLWLRTMQITPRLKGAA